MRSIISSRLSLLMGLVSTSNTILDVPVQGDGSRRQIVCNGFLKRLIMGSLLLLFSHAPVHASLVLIPPSLSAGSQYRLVFSTSTTIQANSTTIATYNTFVNLVAAGNVQLNGISWTAIASTPAVDARDNTNTNPVVDGAGVPIYNLAGSRLANDYADLWDAFLQNPVAVDEFANPTTTDVWTGTGIFGQEDFNTLGLGLATITAGYVTQAGPSWIRGATLSNTGQELSIYAISSLLTVPIPEPASSSLLGFVSKLAFP